MSKRVADPRERRRRSVKSSTRRADELTFRGWGILSPKGMVVEAYRDDLPYAMKRFELATPGSTLVKVTAKLERTTVTRSKAVLAGRVK